MKLIFASPTYGPIDNQAVKSQRIAIMHAAANGHEWLGDASPDRMKFDIARNTIAQEACKTEADYVVWCDSDMVLQADAFTRLAGYGQDFATGIYFQRNPPHWPLIANYNGKSFQWYIKWPPDTLAAIDGCGFGIVLTSVKMLKHMAEKFTGDPRENGWFCYKKFSEDFDFCLRAKELGYQLWVDTGIVCGHLPDAKAVTMETYKAFHPEFFNGGNNNGDVHVRSENENRDLDVPRNGQGGHHGEEAAEAVEVQLG
jgi:hypothetical protein